MTPDELVTALRSLRADDLHRIARSLELQTAGDEVDAWRATMAIDRRAAPRAPEPPGRARGA